MSRTAAPKSTVGSIFFGKFFFEAETTIYVLLSIADLLFTNYLLKQNAPGLQFVESNPVARFFLDHWGPKGMIYFKFIMVAFVCIVTQIIARYRPLTARLVLLFAIAMMLYVVVYSVRLYSAHSQGMPMLPHGPMEESAIVDPACRHV